MTTFEQCAYKGQKKQGIPIVFSLKFVVPSIIGKYELRYCGNLPILFKNPILKWVWYLRLRKTVLLRSSFIHFHTRFSAQEARASKRTDSKIHHDQQHSQIVLLAPHQDGIKQGRRCNHKHVVLVQPLDSLTVV